MCSASHFDLELGVMMWVHTRRVSRHPRGCGSLESSDHEDAYRSRRCHSPPVRTADPGDGHRRLGAGRGRSRADPHRLARPARLESPRDDERARIDHRARRGRRAGGHALDPTQPRAGEQAPATSRPRLICVRTRLITRECLESVGPVSSPSARALASTFLVRAQSSLRSRQ